ncbi:6330505F04Rik protein, putative [Brugia malayi]|nr:6330505F04Rik protein, putative [Brugia malayi]VIP00224.1 6330505F04Rik protein, putative [Brugia malayi]
MTTVVFLIGSSASMAQKTYQGTAMLDVARSIVELILKQRVHDTSARGDRYMLMSFEDFPMNVKETVEREKKEGEAPKDIIKNDVQFLHLK